MTKPNNCSMCLAVEKVKDVIQCGCLRTNTAEITDEEQKKIMWNNCPLKWE